MPPARKMLLELMPIMQAVYRHKVGADQRGQPLDGVSSSIKPLTFQNALQNYLPALPEVAHGTGPVREDTVDVQHPHKEEYTEKAR